MLLLNPAALSFAVLAPLIVLLYLLKVRRQTARVSTLMFWQRVTADHRRHALFQRLRQVLSLLLHLLIFSLLLLALARPEPRAFHGTEAQLSTVVIVDARARMQTRTTGNETRFDEARRVAEGFLHRASARQVVALMAVEGTPRIVVGLTDEEKPLLAGLATTRSTDAGGRIEDAVSLAGELLAGRNGTHRIVVVTDHPLGTTNGSPGEIETHLVGAPDTARENVGIARLSARALPNSSETEEVFVEIENFGSRRQAGQVELSFEDRLVDVKPFDLAPGERHAEVYPALAARTGIANPRGWLTARLALADRSADAFPPDDDAFAVIPPPRPVRVMLVTRGNWFLENLLKADDKIRYEQLTPENFQPAQAASFDAVILDDYLPTVFGDDPAKLPPGNFLFLRQAPLPAAGPELVHPIITDVDGTSPLLSLVNVRDVTILRASSWTRPEATAGDTPHSGDWQFTAPVRMAEHPLVIAGERFVAGRASQRFVGTAFGAADSDLPLRVAFPLFIHNTVEWLAGRERASGASEDICAGESIPLAAGESVWTRPQRTFASPGKVPPSETVTGPGVFQPLHNGFYRKQRADGSSLWLAVNTFDREMSALNVPGHTPLPGGERVSKVEVANGWRAVLRWPPWVCLAAAAFILCTLEWWSFHRRRTE